MQHLTQDDRDRLDVALNACLRTLEVATSNISAFRLDSSDSIQADIAKIMDDLIDAHISLSQPIKI